MSMAIGIARTAQEKEAVYKLRDMVIAILGEGEMFGEMAYLLGIERSTEVYAMSDEVRIVSLREQDINKLIHSESALASKLLYNISRLLCPRPVALHHLLEK